MSATPSARQPGEERCKHDGVFDHLKTSSEPEGIRRDRRCRGCGVTFMVTKGGMFPVAPPSPPAARAPETAEFRDCACDGVGMCSEHIEDMLAHAPADRTAEYAALLRRVVACEEPWRFASAARHFEERDNLMADIRATLATEER